MADTFEPVCYGCAHCGCDPLDRELDREDYCEVCGECDGTYGLDDEDDGDGWF